MRLLLVLAAVALVAIGCSSPTTDHAPGDRTGGTALTRPAADGPSTVPASAATPDAAEQGLGAGRVVLLIDTSGSMIASTAVLRNQLVKRLHAAAARGAEFAIIGAGDGKTEAFRPDPANPAVAAAPTPGVVARAEEFLDDLLPNGAEGVPAGLAAAETLRPSLVWLFTDGWLDPDKGAVAAITEAARQRRYRLCVFVHRRYEGEPPNKQWKVSDPALVAAAEATGGACFWVSDEDHVERWTPAHAAAAAAAVRPTIQEGR